MKTISLFLAIFIHLTPLYAQELVKKIELTETSYGIALSGKNRLIFVAGKDSTGTIWTNSGELLTTLVGHESSVSSISFHEGKSTVLTGSYDDTAILWDLAGNVLARLHGHSNAVINIDQSAELIATASRDKTAAIWNRQGQLLQKFDGHTEQVNAVKFVEEKDWLLTGSFDQTIKIWDYEGRLLNTLSTHLSGVRSLEISLKNRMIITGHRDGYISMMDIDGKMIKTFEAHSGEYAMVNDLEFFNHDLNFFSAGSDGFVRIWSIDGSLINEFKVAIGENAYVSGISFSNGTLVSSHGVDNSFKIWDLNEVQLGHFTCSNPRSAFLNQLLGEWLVKTKDRTSPDVYEDNQGNTTIMKAIDGCGISLSFRGVYKNKPYARESIITCLDSTKVQMIAMDSEHGSFSIYDGEILEDQLVVYWYRNKDEKRLQSKYIMTVTKKDQFEFSSYLSTDHGETWALTHERIYSRDQ